MAYTTINMNSSSDIVVHPSPVLRDQADFIIFAHIEGKGSLSKRWEQLWTRQLSENRFEVCCIPFFVYDIALGDHVETVSENGKRYVVKRVTKQSGHYTFRVWFGDSPYAMAKEEVLVRVKDQLNCLVEWYSQNLLAVDAPTEELAQAIADCLDEKVQLGLLVFETGRTH